VIEKICPICGAKFKVFPCDSSRKYCSKRCYGISKVGIKNPEHSKRMTGAGNPMYGKERICSEETRKQISHSLCEQFKQGRKQWNEGLTKETDERVLRLSSSIREGFRKGRVHPFKGKTKETEPRLEELGKKVQKTVKRKYDEENYVNPMKGKKRPDNTGEKNIMHRPEVKEKVRRTVTLKWKEPGYKGRVMKKVHERLAHSEIWKNATRTNMKRLAANKKLMTPIERKMLIILSDNLKLEINKDFTVKQCIKVKGGYCFPDFNVKAFKTIVECDGEFHRWQKTKIFEKERDSKILNVLPDYKMIHISGVAITRIDESILADYLRNKFLSDKKVSYVVCRE
jgi:very-short-patch-repair endonuclease